MGGLVYMDSHQTFSGGYGAIRSHSVMDETKEGQESRGSRKRRIEDWEGICEESLTLSVIRDRSLKLTTHNTNQERI